MKRTVNERIKAIREELGMTQQDFAEAVGLTSTQLSRIENGQGSPQQSTLNKISKATSVAILWLTDGKGDFAPKLVNLKENSTPWRDEALSNLKDEVNFYRQLLIQVTGGKPLSPFPSPNSKASAIIKQLYPEPRLVMDAV